MSGSPDALAVGTRLQLRYRIEAPLGQGGFGITYRALDNLDGRSVAVKEFYPSGCFRAGASVVPRLPYDLQSFAAAREAFVEEARLVKRFDHHGIVKVFDAFEQNGTAYYTMELLRGGTLAERIQAKGALAGAEVLGLARAVAEALGAVHANGLLHRDVKPDNVFLTDDGRAVLIDFGSARAFAGAGTAALTRLVTSGYSPLEQYATSARYGPYTDLYALGATLYHAIAGNPPPAAADLAQNPGALKPLPAATPPSLAAAVLKCLRPTIGERPQTVSEFLGILRGTPAGTPPPPKGGATVTRVHSGAVLASALAADGKHLVTGSDDLTLRLWEVATDSGSLTAAGTFQGYQAPITAVAFAAAGVIISGCEDGLVMIRRPGDPHVARLNVEQAVVSLAVGAGTLAVATGDRRVRLFDAGTLTLQRTLGPFAHWVTAVALIEPGPVLVVGLRNGSLHLYPLDGGGPVVVSEHRETAVAVVPAGPGLVVSADESGQVLVLDDLGGVTRRLTSFPAGVTALAASGKFVVVGCSDGQLVRVELASGEVRSLPRAGGEVRTVQCSADGKLVLAGTVNGLVHAVVS